MVVVYHSEEVMALSETEGSEGGKHGDGGVGLSVCLSLVLGIEPRSFH